MADSIDAPPFMRLPIEIRLMIYQLLLTDHDLTLRIRTEDPAISSIKKIEPRIRSSYRILSDRFRARSVVTTYCLLENPGISPAILAVNRRIHDEAAHILYSEHIFDFDNNIEAAVPFLQDLSPVAVASIKRINIVKRALPYDKEFDRAEWKNVCSFISRNMELVQLGLGVLGGRPLTGWDANETYSGTDFRMITRFEGMEWARQLADIKGLRTLDVKALVEHCPAPMSSAMSFFVAFSASIETGFADYLRSEMVLQAA
ncbi:MAG: hypothetical protein M1827_002796 [Pycnora praestabilis]|nr:MAG: hypothetical protein M1827_002796 [Pycnora praestabilis]